MYLCTAKEINDFDRYTIEHVGIPGVILMEHAGKAVAEKIIKKYTSSQTVVVLGGTGNNGGDGWVVARYLHRAGWQVHAWLIGNQQKMSTDAKQQYNACRYFIQIKPYDGNHKELLNQQLRNADVIVDALLGTGVRGALRSPFDQVISMINQQKKGRVVSVDLPSGVDTDTGTVHSTAVYADDTVTFSFPKWAHVLRPGADHSGCWEVVDIGIIAHSSTLAQLNTPELWHTFPRKRSPWSHKGQFGHLLVIGGAGGMLGAVKMAGKAAFQMGAGKVTLTVPHSERLACAADTTQAMIWDWQGDKYFNAHSYQDFTARADDFSAVAIGPGLGRFTGEDLWLGALLEKVKSPLILDADALNIIADHPKLLHKRDRMMLTVCTPHPGEMARLMDCSVKEVEENRPKIARDWSKKTGMIVVLKGRYSIIAFPDGKQVVNQTGHPALAKAGSGDLLTGMIGSLLAQGYPSKESISLAVYTHGKAGEQAAAKSSDHSVTYADVLSKIGPTLHQFNL